MHLKIPTPTPSGLIATNLFSANYIEKQNFSRSVVIKYIRGLLIFENEIFDNTLYISDVKSCFNLCDHIFNALWQSHAR